MFTLMCLKKEHACVNLGACSNKLQPPTRARNSTKRSFSVDSVVFVAQGDYGNILAYPNMFKRAIDSGQ